MSSMLKKAGAGAFKPKAPIARRRPAPNVAAQSTAQPEATETQPSPTSAQQPTPGPSQDAGTSSAPSELIPEQPIPPAAANAKSDAPPAPSESSSSPARETPNRSESSRDAPPVLKVTGSAAPISEPTDEPAAPTQPSTAQASSIQPEQTTTTSQRPIEPATPSTAPEAVAVVSPKPTGLNKSTSAGGSKPTRPTAVPKPVPIPETSAPEPRPVQIVTAFPTLSSDSVTPSVENGEAPSTAPTSKAAKPARKPAARQPRKRKADTTTAGSGAEAGIEAEGPPKKKRAPRKKKAVGTGTDEVAPPEGAQTTAAKRRPQRNRKAADYVEGDAEDQEGERDEDFEASGSEEQAATQQPKKKRRKRSITPEDAESRTIDPETITLGQLTRDPRTGKRWDKAALIETSELERKREQLKMRLIKKGLLKEGEELPGSENSEAGTPAPESSTPAPEPPAPAAPPPQNSSGLKYRIVDGQIVLDDTTLNYDRHAEADQQRGDLEAHEEHEFSRRTTQYTLMRRKTSGNSWTAEETEEFYKGLRAFGTDFGMISMMFGGAKSRRQVKLKFNREERANPAAINSCLVGEKTVPMTLDAIHGAEDLEESQAIKDELAREREEREAEARREDEERAAENRQKAADLGRGKKGRDRGKNNTASHAEEEGDGEGGGGPAAGPRAKSRQKEVVHPGAKYGVGVDPDVIDETDLPTPAGRGGRAVRGRGRGGRRGGISFGSGFGA